MARPVSLRKRMLIASLAILVIGVVGSYLGWQAWGVHHFHAADDAMARRDFSEARLRLDKCLRVWPSDGETLLLAARGAARDGDASEAERLLDAAAKEMPDAVTVERRVMRLRAGDLTDADRYYSICSADRDKPESKLILDGLIEGALRARHLEFAVRCLTLWEESQTGPWDLLQAKFWRGEIAYYTAYTDIALVRFREVVEAAPGNDAARLRLAEVLIQYAPIEAKVHLEALAAKRPTDRNILIRLASCHRALGEHESAAIRLDEMLSRSPKDVPVLLERGRVALDLRQLDEAERWFRSAEALAPQYREVYLELARCLQLAGKPTAAQIYRDKIAKADAAPEAKPR